MLITQFNGLDWAIVAVLALSAVLSLWRGFVREAMSLVGWVAAFVVANLFAQNLALALADVIDNSTGRMVASYVILFVGVLMAANIVSLLLVQVIRFTGLTPLDRLLGTLFGFALGLIVILVFIFVARQMLPDQNQQWVLQSQLMPHLEMLVQWVESVFLTLGDSMPAGISI